MRREALYEYTSHAFITAGPLLYHWDLTVHYIYITDEKSIPKYLKREPRSINSSAFRFIIIMCVCKWEYITKALHITITKYQYIPAWRAYSYHVVKYVSLPKAKFAIRELGYIDIAELTDCAIYAIGKSSGLLTSAKDNRRVIHVQRVFTIIIFWIMKPRESACLSLSFLLHIGFARPAEWCWAIKF